MRELEHSVRRPRFDPSRDFVARKAFALQGRRFAPGEPVPWQRMAVSLRLLRQLYQQGRIQLGTASPAAAVPVAAPVIQEAPVPVPTESAAPFIPRPTSSNPFADDPINPSRAVGRKR